jgi:hypothetical protein
MANYYPLSKQAFWSRSASVLIPRARHWQNPVAGTSRLLEAIRNRDSTEPFDRLIKLNWRGYFVVTFAAMLFSFLIAGFWYPYWRIADMDFWVVYNAFLLNAHLPQEYFDHPGYIPILLLSYWLRALHAVRIIRIDSFSALPPLSNLGAFSAAWTEATQAGRVLSLIIAVGFVTTFFYLLRALLRDWRIAGLGGFLLAFSGGMGMQMRTLRTELLAAGLFMTALLMLMVAAKRGERPWRPVVFGLAGALITLGMQSKVQIFFLICALPVLLLPFGPDAQSRSAAPSFWRTPRRAWPALALSAAVAALAAYLASDIIVLGFSEIASTERAWSVLSVGARTYWAIVAIWIGLGMVTYGLVWRVAPLETLAAMFAAVAGCMIGLLVLFVRFEPGNVIAVFRPLETMLTWGGASDPRLISGGHLFDSERIQFLLQAIAGVIERRTFFLYSSPRPAIFLEWFVIAATVVAIRRRQWLLVAQVAALMLTDWAVDTLGMGRRLQQQYFLFTDPLAIIAAALLILNLKDLQRHRWAYPVGIALIAVHIVVSQAEPVKHLFFTSGPELLCDQQAYFRRIQLSFCPTTLVNVAQ